MSSTTIIFKAFDDMGLRTNDSPVSYSVSWWWRIYRRIINGITSTVAVSKHVEGMEMLDSGGQIRHFPFILFRCRDLFDPLFLKRQKLPK